MAEVVGTVASVAQLVQLSGALLAGGYNFLSKVARAPSEIRSLLTETAAVNSLLAQLQQIADTSPKAAADDALQALERVGVFQECQLTLKSIEQALAKCEQVNGQDTKNFGRKLMWPFKEKETKDALQRLHHMRGLLANAIEANSASAIRRIETGQGLILDEVKNMSEQLRTQMSREEVQKGRYPNLATTHVVLAENMRPDIQHYVAEDIQARVAKGVLKVRNKDILSSIRQQVVLRAGTMLQARLKIDYICTAKSDKEIKIIVQNLPHGLGHTYEALLCDIATRYTTRIEEVQKLFRCLTTAATPLTAPELAEILAMQPDERDLDHDAVVTDPYDVLEPISTLIRIESFENQRSVIRLCHFTLEDYLTSTNIQESPASLFYVSESEAETWMADICLQHLTMETFNAPLDYGLDLDLDQDYAFRTYAALSWFNHASALVYRLHLDDPSRPALGRFLDAEEGPPCYKRWQSLIAKILPNAEFLDYSPTCMCIWAELHVTARELCQRLPNMDYQFENGLTCLTVAAKEYDHMLVRYLLDHGAKVDEPTRELGQFKALTPLHFAAEWDSLEDCGKAAVKGIDRPKHEVIL
ncbi:hypothetical protein J4E81_009381 [Alternaria sp. BMP 2799]|nr:hypothetical protein J4E81_009381 [Alternaria sp. BMP 2799]